MFFFAHPPAQPLVAVIVLCLVSVVFGCCGAGLVASCVSLVRCVCYVWHSLPFEVSISVSVCIHRRTYICMLLAAHARTYGNPCPILHILCTMVAFQFEM